MYHPRYLLFFCLALFCSVNAQAKSYQIELIIFEHASDELAGDYAGVDGALATELDELISLDSRDDDLPSDRRYRKTRYSSLENMAKRIDRSERYRLLKHIAWVQPGIKRSRAKKIRIHSDTIAIDELGNSVYVLDGNVQVALGRYLHLYTDFRLVTPGDDAFNSLVSHQLVNHRRMRSKQIHYIDHPKIGIIANIIPL